MHTVYRIYFAELQDHNQKLEEELRKGRREYDELQKENQRVEKVLTQQKKEVCFWKQVFPRELSIPAHCHPMGFSAGNPTSAKSIPIKTS